MRARAVDFIRDVIGVSSFVSVKKSKRYTAAAGCAVGEYATLCVICPVRIGFNRRIRALSEITTDSFSGCLSGAFAGCRQGRS